MITSLICALSLNLVVPAGSSPPIRLLDQALSSPVDSPASPTENPLGHEVAASLGISVGMLGLAIASAFILPSGDCGGCLLAATFPVALGLTPFLTSSAVWALERGSRPDVAWWPIFLASAVFRIGGALLMWWGVSTGPRAEPIVTGIGLSLVGGTIAEVVTARWGAGQAVPTNP